MKSEIHQIADSIASFNLDEYKKELLIKSLSKVLDASRFISSLTLRFPDDFRMLAENGLLFQNVNDENILHELKEIIFTRDDETLVENRVRKFRNRHLLRIAWRDISDWSDTEQTLLELSWLAQSIVSTVMDYLFSQHINSKGTPYNSYGDIQKPVILGMGKLGAWELNFSSDIDLVFFYEEDGQIEGRKSLSFHEFYTKLIQSFIKFIDSSNEYGFIYRVDTRLRPFGNSGPLAISFDGAELYYQSQAREWERYAMVKARAIYGDAAVVKRLESVIHPFVYRKYLDYRAFGEIREMKEKIKMEVKKRDCQDNIKIGLGGIREIEFIGQVFQLVRGGHEKSLRQRGIIAVLTALSGLGFLPAELVHKLIQNYLFLRKVENRLQQYDDQQTHEIPSDESSRTRLARSLGYSVWADLGFEINRVRQEVHAAFSSIIEYPNPDEESDLNIKEISAGDIEDQIVAYGFLEVEVILELLRSFKDSLQIKRLTSRGNQELSRLLPLVFRYLVNEDNQIEAFQRLLKLLESVASRNVYYTLLIENPIALSQLVRLASKSSWIINFIAKYPILLDELLDPRSLFSPVTKDVLESELDRCLSQIEVQDFEQFLGALRKYKQSMVLRIAAADIMGHLPLMVVSDCLSWLAETILCYALEYAWQYTLDKQGLTQSRDRKNISGFAIIAYGKLGGYELSYASDLDIVFLYDESLGDFSDLTIPFYSRVVKRLIMILSTQSLSGILYEVDLRLRPSGNSGLLISSLEAYEKYQMESSWTWEQQALVRARFVAGDERVGGKFRIIRSKSLCRVRELSSLKKEVKEMRNKMRVHLEQTEPGFFDLKQAFGGITDIEFVVQFGVLLLASESPALTQWTDVMRLLESLMKVGFFTPQEALTMKEAYRQFREETHRAALLEKPAMAQSNQFILLRDNIRNIWLDKVG